MCISAGAMMAMSMGMQAVSAVQKGRQEKAYYNHQAQQAEADAQAEREAGRVRADKVRKAGRSQQSQARAALAASGVDLSVGSALKIEQQIGRDSEEDALSELLTGQRRGQRLASEAGGYRAAGKNAMRSGIYGAGSSLMAGYGKVKSGWLTPQQQEYQQQFNARGAFNPDS